MKNLITIVAVCFSIATGFAQDTKPTKEETVAYINNILSTSLGVWYKYEEPGDFSKVISQKFSLEEYTYTDETTFDYKVNDTEIYSFIKIPWHTLKSISEVSKLENGLSIITVSFEDAFIENIQRVENVRLMNGNTRKETSNRSTSVSSIVIYITPSKIENLKKAFLHLKELTYKPDPFAN